MKYGQLFGNRQFAKLWAGQLFSALGDSLWYVALLSMVYDLRGSTADVGTALMVIGSATVLAAPLAGLVVDLYSRKHIIIFSALIRGGLIALLAKSPPYSIIIVILFLSSLVQQFFNPALNAFIPSLLEEKLLVTANGILALTFKGVSIIGPVIGGYMVERVGYGAAWYVSAGTCFVLAGCVLTIPQSTDIKIPKLHRTYMSVLESYRQSIRYIKENALLIFVVVQSIIMSLAGGVIDALLIVFAKIVLGIGAQGFTLILAFKSIGFVLGLGTLGVLQKKFSRTFLIPVALILIGVEIVFFSFNVSYGLALLLSVVDGAGNSLINVFSRTTLQDSVPDRLRGKVFATNYMLFSVAHLVSAGVGGIMAQYIPIRLIFLACGLLVGSWGLYGYVWLRNLTESESIRNQRRGEVAVEISQVSRDRSATRVAEVVLAHPLLREQFLRYQSIVSPFELVYLYLARQGVCVLPDYKRMIQILNQDLKTILLHFEGTNYCGSNVQNLDGIRYNDQSEFSYDPLAQYILYDGREISDLVVHHVKRSPSFGQYYIKSLSVWDGPVLNLDENDGFCPGGCHFCSKPLRIVKQVELNTEQIFHRVMQDHGLDSLQNFREIAIITGLFENETVGVNYVLNVARLSAELGFRGILNYMTCQLRSENGMESVASVCKNLGLKPMYIYSIEKYFDRRSIMGPLKGDLDIDQIFDLLVRANSYFGALGVGYNYILGAEPFSDFAKGFVKLTETKAIPHLNIFVSITPKIYSQKRIKERRKTNMAFQPANDFAADEIGFILRARKLVFDCLASENSLYLQNNCGNLFCYPAGHQHLYAQFIRFVSVDWPEIDAFGEWMETAELDKESYENEFAKRLQELQKQMTSVVDCRYKG